MPSPKPKPKVVCYTGVGAKRGAVHSPAEFLRAMNTGRVCSRNCPAADDLDAWVDWSGAIKSTPARCAKTVAKNRRIDAAARRADRAAAAFDRCVAAACDASEPVPPPAHARCAALKCTKQAARLAKASTAHKASYK